MRVERSDNDEDALLLRAREKETTRKLLEYICTPVVMPARWSFLNLVYRGGKSNTGRIFTMRQDSGVISPRKRNAR
jgi:hypothetical protein